MNNSTNKQKELKFQIKELEQMKTTLTNVDEIKIINKQINAMQEKLGRLKDEIKDQKYFAISVEKEFDFLLSGDD